MADFDIPAIAAELNKRASSHPVGQLQRIRKNLHKKSRLAGNDIFRIGSKIVTAEWACHFGGRPELQFNIGVDGSCGKMLRHGVAFSFETSRDLPTIDVLRPKVRLFNDFIQHYPETFAAMRMWHWRGTNRSEDYGVGLIPSERVTEGIFLFLGKLLPIEQLDYELILNDFDGLLPLYRYIESDGKEQPISLPDVEPFSFSPGCSMKAKTTVSILKHTDIDVTLRHNALQEALCRRLLSQFGAENVRDECPCAGMRVDVVVQQQEGYWFYEIKTSHSPRACIRTAIGQLLEYAFWPSGQEASRLIVVGESPLDQDGTTYLEQLRARFALPIYYEQIIV